jgi:hypothetical protein
MCEQDPVRYCETSLKVEDSLHRYGMLSKVAFYRL